MSSRLRQAFSAGIGGALLASMTVVSAQQPQVAPPAPPAIDRAAMERQMAENRRAGSPYFRRIAHVPVAAANLPVGHGGTFNEDNGGSAAGLAVSWLQWQLRGDAEAGRRFTGADCGLCKDAKWTLERRNFPN